MLKIVVTAVALIVVTNTIWYLIFKAQRKTIQSQDEDLADLAASLAASEAEVQIANDQIRRMKETNEKANAVKSGSDAIDVLSQPTKKTRKSKS